MKCSYLSVDDGKNVCKRMEEEGMGGEVSDFDVQLCSVFAHFDKQNVPSSEITATSIHTIVSNVDVKERQMKITW
jgi:hypothetical protein